MRELIDATIRTEVDAAIVAEVKAQIDAATARLRAKQLPGPFGVRYTGEGNGMAWGNPAIGVASSAIHFSGMSDGIVKLFGNACGAVDVSGPAGERWWLTASFKPLRR